MTFDYAKFEKLAQDQIKDKGRTITLRTPTTAFTPSTGAMTTTNSDQMILAVFTQIASNQIDGTLVQAGDKMCLLASKDVTGVPTTDDQIVDGTDVWYVQDVEEVKPGGTSILYKLRIRR